MKILVLADTHVYNMGELPLEIVEELAKVDLVLHAGDYIGLNLLEELKHLGNFLGVHGNHDKSQVKEILPTREIVEISGLKLGIIHGDGSLFGCRSILKNKFKDDKVDMIIYGHTHVADNQLVDETYFFNPGSVWGRFPAAHQSYGIITINGSISPSIIQIKHSRRSTKPIPTHGLARHLSILAHPYPAALF